MDDDLVREPEDLRQMPEVQDAARLVRGLMTDRQRAAVAIYAPTDPSFADLRATAERQHGPLTDDQWGMALELAVTG